MKSAKTAQPAAIYALTHRASSPFTPRSFHASQHNPLQDNQWNERKENRTGLPDRLKTGIENLSGYSLDDVKVHYNSHQPDQLHALAYAQGTDIHIASGQEKHLPHEAWHIVQQKQGRVKPTLQMKGGVKVNDDQGLESEADVMGAKASQFMGNQNEVTMANDNGIHLQAPIQKIKIKPGLSVKLKSKHAPIQRLMKKLGVDAEKYKLMLRSTVYLYAEFNGVPVGENGIFYSQNGDHAEEHLIAFIKAKDLRNGKLAVWLSTSPCSSVFCTREDGEKGCQERLEKLLAKREINVEVKADHLYQPKETGAMERENNFPTAFSSFSALATSSFPMTVSALPVPFRPGGAEFMAPHTDDRVAQLKKINV